MLYGETYHAGSQQDQVQPKTWLDDLVASNPQGVMQVLARNGYVGYLAPQTAEELSEAACDFIEKQGEDAVVELIHAHPLYDVIAGVSGSANRKFGLNATGDDIQVPAVIKNIDYRKVIETSLMIIGALYIAGSLIGLLGKE